MSNEKHAPKDSDQYLDGKHTCSRDMSAVDCRKGFLAVLPPSSFGLLTSIFSWFSNEVSFLAFNIKEDLLPLLLLLLLSSLLLTLLL